MTKAYLSSFLLAFTLLAYGGCSSEASGDPSSDSGTSAQTKVIHVGGKDYTVPVDCCVPDETFNCGNQQCGGKGKRVNGVLRCDGICGYDGPVQTITGYKIDDDGCLGYTSIPVASGAWCGAIADAGPKEAGSVVDAGSDADAAL